MEGSRVVGDRGWEGGGVMAEGRVGCGVWRALMMLSGVEVGSMICDVWWRQRARIGRRKVGGSRVTGVRSSRTERRSALLIVVVTERVARGC